jgi:hypothetical protein
MFPFASNPAKFPSVAFNTLSVLVSKELYILSACSREVYTPCDKSDFEIPSCGS